MARYLYSELASLLDARKRCSMAMERLNPNAVSADVPMHQNEYHLRSEWFDKHTATIERLVSEHLPNGSGFDNSTKIDLDASHAEKLVFHTSYHHMNESGCYDGWTEHTVTVTPSLWAQFHLRISGRNHNEIKDYVHECFSSALAQDLYLVDTEYRAFAQERGLLK